MNKLNVFGYGYNRKRFVFHNIKQFFKNVKRAWQRATRGFCDWDEWDLDHFLLPLIEDALKSFRKNNNGHPSFLTESQWDDLLYEMTECFHYAQEENLQFNPYAEEFHEMLKKHSIEDDLHWDHNFNETEQELRNNYFEWENRLENKRAEYLRKGMELLTTHMKELWW